MGLSAIIIVRSKKQQRMGGQRYVRETTSNPNDCHQTALVTRLEDGAQGKNRRIGRDRIRSFCKGDKKQVGVGRAGSKKWIGKTVTCHEIIYKGGSTQVF